MLKKSGELTDNAYRGRSYHLYFEGVHKENRQSQLYVHHLQNTRILYESISPFQYRDTAQHIKYIKENGR